MRYHQLLEVRKAMLTHFSNLNLEQQTIAIEYYEERLAGLESKVPSFMNSRFAISSIEKIDQLFGSIDQFWSDIYGIIARLEA